MINHIFKNIDEALDYVLCEEIEALQNDAFRSSPPNMFSLQAMNFFRPFNEEDAKKSIIAVDSLDYPLSGFFNKADTSSFIMTRLQSGRFSLKPNLRKRKYLFRGENSFHDTNVPNMFRTKANRFTCESVAYQEMFLVILSHPLVQLLDLGIVMGNRRCVFEVNLWGLTQHYYNKTTLLDLTSDPNVASFFAVTTYDAESDCYRPVSAEGEGVLYYYDLDIRNSFQPTLQHINGNINTIGLQIFPRSGTQRGFLLNMEKGQNFNNFTETNYVKFKHNAEISQRIFEEFEKGKKLFPNDILQAHWKNHKKNTVSNKTMLLNQSINSDYTMEQLRKEVIDAGWSIENYQPNFSSEELHSYYQDIKNGMWGAFCDKIFIPGDKDGKMKEDLLMTEKKAEYSWAFQEDKIIDIDYQNGFLLKKYARFL